MSHWYAKARETLTGRITSSEPEPFSRPCTCGETIYGERLPQAREVVCPNCGRDWFILPRDPYPQSKSRRKTGSPPPDRPRWMRLRSERRAPSGPAAAISETVSEGDTAAAEEIAIDPPVSLVPPVKTLPGRAAAEPRQRRRWRDVRQAGRDWVRREARPIRFVLAGTVALVAATGLWLWHSARLDDASATIVRVVPQAEQALSERDFNTAELLFAEAVAAVDLLGTDDATATRIRQRHRELVVLNDLAGKTPFDLAVDAQARGSNPDNWESEFQASYAGRWVVFDVPLDAPLSPAKARRASQDGKAPSSTQADGYPIELSLDAGTTPVRFEIDSDLFRPLKNPARAIFAAQYGSWERRQTSGKRETWIVRFRPGTAFLWTSGDTYATLGFDLDDPETRPREILKHQSDALGIPVKAPPLNGDPPSDTEQNETVRGGAVQDEEPSR